MKKNTELLVPDTFYHIYNRGINGTSIFLNENNYKFFLVRYSLFISPVADTYAYCLLNNHFHFLIKTKTEQELIINIDKQSNQGINRNTVLPAIQHKDTGKIISNKFSNLFNSYTQAFNKMNNRTGGLFETPFRRISVSSEAYFTQLVYYIHYNPQRHGIIYDFRKYPFSSYNSFLSNKETKLKRTEVLKWFGDKTKYKKMHDDGIDMETIVGWNETLTGSYSSVKNPVKVK